MGTTSTSPSGERSHISSNATFDPGRAFDRTIGVLGVDLGAFVGLLQRDRAQLAVEVKTPGVVRADQRAAGIALLIAKQLHTAMRAAVVQHVDLAVLAAHHGHWLAADLHRVVVARLGHLTLVSTVDPGLLENTVHFEVENRLIGVYAAMNPVGFDQLGDVQGVSIFDCHLNPQFSYSLIQIIQDWRRT
jgi:hypothetical protein